MKLIVLFGIINGGKTYSGNKLHQIASESGLKSSHYSFGDDLKNKTADELNITMDELERLKRKGAEVTYDNEVMTCRDAIIKIANKYREIDDDYFTKIVLHQIERDSSYINIISDCRFIEEINAIMSYSPYFIFIENKSIEREVNESEILDEIKLYLKDYPKKLTLDNTGYSLTEDDYADALDIILKTQ